MKHGTCHHSELKALRRIEGQIRGVQGMIEQERYCVDILNAIGAAVGALHRVEKHVLKGHLDACVKTAFTGTSKKEKKEKLDEILGLLDQLRK